MTLHTNRLGERGEKLAELWLTNAGWKILSRRFRSGHRDIDIVAAKREAPICRTVAFVEVKTRTDESFGGPLAAVNWKKQRELRRSAQVWISRFSRPEDQFRFDVIGILLGGDRVRVQHIKNAFLVSAHP